MSPGPDSARPHTTPEGRDIRLLVMGVFLFAGAMLNAGLPQIKGPSHAIGLVVVLVIFLALLALPAHTLRGRKGDWRRFTIWYGKTLLALAGMSIAGQLQRMEQGQSSLDVALQTGRITIDGYMRAQRAAAPVKFESDFIRNYEQALKAAEPEVTFSNITLAGVTEGDGWLRTLLTYDAVPAEDDHTVKTSGRIAVYYHARGMAIVKGWCAVAEEGCAEIDTLMATAEGALRLHLNGSGVDGVLPEPGLCSTDAIDGDQAADDSLSRTCSYDQGVELTFARVAAAATIDGLSPETTGLSSRAPGT